MKLLILLSFLVPLSSSACIGEIIIVDIDKAKKFAEVVADHIVVRSAKRLKFETKMNVKFLEREKQTTEKLFLYDIRRESSEKMTGIIIVKNNQRTLELKATVLAQKKGGCSQGKVIYD